MTISTISFNTVSRAQIMRLQAELKDALTESTTSRHADVGRTLGRLTADAVSFRSQETSLDRLLQSNVLVTQRLTLMEDSLETVGKTAEAVRNQLIAGLGNPDFLRSAKEGATSALDQFAGALNLTAGGQYLFGGSQTDIRPIVPYEGGPRAAVRAHFEGFLAAAGRTEATVTAAETEAYFGAGFDTGRTVVDADGNTVPEVIRFSSLFEDASWKETFSNAADTPIRSRISKSETIDSSVSVNGQAFRDLVSGYAMLDLASAAMGADVRAKLASAASGRIASGSTGLTALRSDLGNRMVRVEAADEALKQQKDIVSISLASLEEVDTVEAADRVSALRTQLEATLRATEMIRQMNILDYF